MPAHPPRESVLPKCKPKPAAIGPYTDKGNHYFCDAHRPEAHKVLKTQEAPSLPGG